MKKVAQNRNAKAESAPLIVGGSSIDAETSTLRRILEELYFAAESYADDLVGGRAEATSRELAHLRERAFDGLCLIRGLERAYDAREPAKS
jgi:hypothetical protein